MTTTAAQLTRADVGRYITIHRPSGDVEGILLGITHGRTSTSLHVSEFVPHKTVPGGRYQQGYFHDPADPIGTELTVTVGDVYVEPSATSPARPERSPDYATRVNSRFD